MQEIYQEIPGFGGRYEASNTGKIRNIATNRILAPYVLKSGYHQIKLKYNGEYRHYYVHRLVLSAFKRTSDYSKIQTNHIDLNKGNNYINNLEWVTPKQNIEHAMKHGRTPKPKYLVYCEEENLITKGSYKMNQILRSRGHNTSAKLIRDCMNGLQKHHAGLTFILMDRL
jgi:hypothetical protein